MVFISLDYSTFLQHSIESFILDNKPIICLIFKIAKNQFSYFFPEYGTNTNYALLNEKTFQGISYSISNKFNQEEEKDMEDLMNMWEVTVKNLNNMVSH